MAGAGKSTISRTLCLSFHQLGYFGGQFFFKRGESDRGGVSRLFTTMTKQLATRYPRLAIEIKRAIDDDLAIGKGLQQQFRHLILDPLKNVGPKDKLIILLMDALDESEQDDENKYLISLLATSRNIPLKIFITSRPEPDMRLGFLLIYGDHQNIILHEVPTHLTRRDISLYFQG